VEQFFTTQKEKTTKLLLVLDMTVGQLAGWLSTVGIGLVFGAYKLYTFIETRGKKIGEDEARENYQLDTIDTLLEDYRKIKEDIETLYKDKANKDDLQKLLDRFDRLMTILIANSKNGD